MKQDMATGQEGALKQRKASTPRPEVEPKRWETPPLRQEVASAGGYAPKAYKGTCAEGGEFLTITARTHNVCVTLPPAPAKLGPGGTQSQGSSLLGSSKRQ
ncbi:hypothetical protein DPEC_G00017440 [Dallia pectoralis]|uniref:Uncharacterized protein n=1 Tax=Dallia pectoralis TaxID=75939 RepID=A0ACC2HF76_DALPE|nr:hypothetical protein DPEC_G00017440 [Dallia pectoralis]